MKVLVLVCLLLLGAVSVAGCGHGEGRSTEDAATTVLPEVEGVEAGEDRRLLARRQPPTFPG